MTLHTHYTDGFSDIRPSASWSTRTKITLEHKNLCRELFENFSSYKKDAQAERWSLRLTDADFTINEVKRGVDVTVSTCERMPSFAEFSRVIRNNSKRIEPEKLEEIEADKKSAELRRFSNEYLQMFLQKYSQKQLNDLLNKWWDGVYGGNSETFGFPKKTFLPIFFQDLVEAKGSIEKAIKLGVKKAKRTK